MIPVRSGTAGKGPDGITGPNGNKEGKLNQIYIIPQVIYFTKASILTIVPFVKYNGYI